MDTAMDTEKRINNIRPAASDTKAYMLCNSVIEILLVCLLAFMPVAFGVVHQASRLVVIVICAAIFLVFMVRQVFFAGAGLIKTWAYLPAAAFILLAIFTVIPMSQKTVSVFSDQTVKLKSELLEQNSTAEQNEKTTLSFYPHGTKEDLRIILAVVTVFVVVLNVFQTREQIKRLLTAIAVIGFCVALLAIAQDTIGNGEIYGFVESPEKVISGPFVNHSHFGQFMNLSIGAMLSIVLMMLYREFEEKEATASSVFEYFDTSRAKRLWLFVAMISMSASALFASLTRGGMLSMLAAMCVTVILLSARRAFRRHGWMVIVVALVALVCLLYTGFDTVYERFATLSSLDKYGTRLEILRDMTEPIRRFFVFGSGLGTHAVIYPMFQSIITALQFTHAENEYAQLIEETGVAGALIMILFAAIIAVNFVKAIRNRKSSVNVAAYGLGFGLIAILIHSVSDFGQHLPANAMLSVIFCAIIIRLGRAKENPQSAETVQIKKPLLIIIFAAVVCLYGWSIIGAAKAAVAERYWHKACKVEDKLLANRREGTQDDFGKLISYASRAVQIQPDNIEYQHWLGVWRWWRVSGNTDPDIGGLTNEAMAEVEKIVADLKQAEKTCPTFGPIYCLMGQLQKFVLLEPVGEDNIKKGFMLEPNDEISLFAAGCLDIGEQKNIESFEKFRKSAALGGSYFKDIVEIYINQAKRPDLAIEIAADDTRRLRYVADVLAGDEQFSSKAGEVILKIVELAERKAWQNTADVWELSYAGDYYQKIGDNFKAAQYFTDAVAADYGNADLRLKLARALAANSQPVEAIKQLRICLKLKPAFRQAEKLLGELSLNPEVIKQNIEDTETK